MKLKELLYGASALVILGAAAASCTTEMVSPYPDLNNGKTSMLVHAPDFFAWSGNQQLGNSRAAYSRADDEIVIQVNDITTKNLNEKEEKTYVDETLPEESDNLPEYIDDDFVYYTTQETHVQLFLVFSQTGQDHEFGLFYYTKSGEMKTKVIWNSVDKGNFKWDGTCEGKEVIIPAGVFFGFYIDKGNNIFPVDAETHYNTVDPGPLYSSSSLNPASYHVFGNGNWACNTESTPSKQHAVTWTRTFDDGSTRSYIGFEDWCDFDFQDLVFTYTPELKTVNSTDFNPGETEIPEDPGTTTPTPAGCPNHKCDHPESSHNPDGTCNECGEDVDCNHKDTPAGCPNHKCDHPASSHNPDGTCNECGENVGCNHKDNTGSGNTPEGPTTETPAKHNDEVEVNFSINDSHSQYDVADLWTKLSIHVRKGTDVKIRVPLDGAYFCESDDFAILQDHANGIYTGMDNELETTTTPEGLLSHHEMTYTITSETKTWNVTLSVDIATDGMTVYTNGIDEDLIDYLFEQNGDGINFEIWNYFQTETIDWIDGQGKVVKDKLTPEERSAFQGYLDQSTIEFLNENPSFYINAFGYNWTDGTYTQEIRPLDCLVQPLKPGDFELFPNYCYHLNGTPWNIIWVEKNVDKKSDNYIHHTVTPKVPVAVDLDNPHRTTAQQQ